MVRLIPLFFPKTIRKLIDSLNRKPLIYDESGRVVDVCSAPTLHRLVGGKCVWCGRSYDELLSGHVQEAESSIISKPSDVVPLPDLDSPTTATVNAIEHDLLEEIFIDPKKSASNPSSMDLSSVEAYCLRCKKPVKVLNPSYNDVDSRRGTRRYLLGNCAVCDCKINAIVKRV